MTKFRRNVTYAVVAATTYNIWQSRNESLWCHKVPVIRIVTSNIEFVVKSIISAILPEKISQKDRRWFNELA